MLLRRECAEVRGSLYGNAKNAKRGWGPRVGEAKSRAKGRLDQTRRAGGRADWLSDLLLTRDDRLGKMADGGDLPLLPRGFCHQLIVGGSMIPHATVMPLE